MRPTEGITELPDANGDMIVAGDTVSLDGNMTADNSLGLLPNGWFFDEEDIYEVYVDPRIGKLSLLLGEEFDGIPLADLTPYNRKFMNHAVSLLWDGHATLHRRTAAAE